jgi:hypothetical protein
LQKAQQNLFKAHQPPRTNWHHCVHT